MHAPEYADALVTALRSNWTLDSDREALLKCLARLSPSDIGRLSARWSLIACRALSKVPRPRVVVRARERCQAGLGTLCHRFWQ